jgi:hypothetical protein
MATGCRSPVPLAKFQMAPAPSALMSSGFKTNEPRYLCLSEARASHSHRTCTEVSSSVPHFLQVGSLLRPITCRCLLRVLCPVSRPVTALDCVLLKDNSRAPMARLGPEITGSVCSNPNSCQKENFVITLVYEIGLNFQSNIENRTRCNKITVFIDLQDQLNMFQVILCPSSGA